MNRTTPLLAMTFLLAAGVLFFSSCASNKIKNPQPPVTVTNPDPVSAPVTKPQDVAAPRPNLNRHQPVVASRKAHRTGVHAGPVVLAAPAVTEPKIVSALAVIPAVVPMAANVQQISKGNGWPWFLLLLLLLLLLAPARRLWNRYQEEKEALAINAALVKKGLLAKVARLAHEAMLRKRARLAHKAKLSRDAELARRAKLAREAESAHEAMLAKRARLAHQAKLAGDAELEHEAELAKEAALARKKGLLAKVAALARKVLLTKRNRLAHKAKLAKAAERSHQAKLARDAELARAAKDAQSAHEAKLARDAKLAHEAKLAKDAELAYKLKLAKAAEFAPPAVLAKNTPLTQAGIGAIGAEYLHPKTLSKDVPMPRKAVLLKGKGLADEVVLAKDVHLMSGKGFAKAAGLGDDEILVQGAGMAEVVKVTIKRGATFEEIIVSVARMGNFPAQNAHLFLENEQVPLNPNHRVEADHPRHLIHHVHTQKEIGVAAHFNGQELGKNFSPATSVRTILAWAIREFKIPDQDGREVYLSIPGTTVPMSDTTHIGRYVPYDQNKLALNVMTPERVIAGK